MKLTQEQWFGLNEAIGLNVRIDYRAFDEWLSAFQYLINVDWIENINPHKMPHIEEFRNNLIAEGVYDPPRHDRHRMSSRARAYLTTIAVRSKTGRPRKTEKELKKLDLVARVAIRKNLRGQKFAECLQHYAAKLPESWNHRRGGATCPDGDPMRAYRCPVCKKGLYRLRYNVKRMMDRHEARRN